MNKGDRVIVTQRLYDNTLYSYGEGVYLGKKMPCKPSHLKAGILDDCVLLDNGRYIWGFQAMIHKYHNKDFLKGLNEFVHCVVEVETEKQYKPYGEC